VSAAAPSWGRGLRLLAGLAALALLSPDSRAQDGRRKQEIQLGELPARTVDDAPFELIAKSTSGLAVAFEVVSGPAVMDGKNLRLTGTPGLVIVRATQEGNAAFLPAVPAERAFGVSARPSAPLIKAQPVPVAVSIGDMIVLSVQASGEPLPGFQWRKEGIEIAGATQRSLTIASATPSDAGSYDAVASNPSGSATSARARVSVGKRTQSISFQSPAQATAGQPVTLTASASSGLPVQFQVLSGIATLSGSTVTPQSGTVVIQASQDGDSSYDAAAPVTQTFQVVLSPTGQRLP
jgi:hypothetical protein